MTRLTIRTRLLLIVVAAVGVAVVALVIGFNLILMRTLDRDASSLARSRATSGQALVHIENGKLAINADYADRSADAYIWVFANGQTIQQPTIRGPIARAAATLKNGPARFLDVQGADARLYASPVFVDGRRVGTIVAGVSVAPYEETRQVTLVASAVFGVLVLILVAVVARLTLAYSLRPVRTMTRQAASWSERDLNHRFALGEPRDELSELAATLDGLLDRIAASLRREQQFSAELSHELRTPLARVRAEAELALRRDREPTEYREALELIHENAIQLARTLDALVAAARHETGTARGTADAGRVVADALDALQPLADERHIDVEVTGPPSTLRVGVETDLASRIIQPVLENAIRYGHRHVSVSVARANGFVRYTIDDDGPGVMPDERELIFEPGRRGSASTRGGIEGSGLGLSLTRRLVHSVSGEVTSITRDEGGSFAIDLPTG
jgi:two-component system, OmpR family, sensor kinase